MPGDRRAGLSEEEKRTLARALNLARRQLDQAGKRAIVADQLRETPGRSNRWIGKQLGVHHATVAAVRSGLEGTGQIIQLERTVGADNKSPPGDVPGRRPVDRRAEVAPSDTRVSLDGEEAILRAAAEIRQRRVAEQLRKVQERHGLDSPPHQAEGRAASSSATATT